MKERRIEGTGVSLLGITAALVVAALVAGCNSSKDEPLLPHQVVSASGDVSGAVAQFRALLGDPLNGVTPGSQPAGRREINWDAVPAAFTNNDALPGDFFNTRSPRGAVFTGPAFRVSDQNLAEVDPSYASQFTFFSPRKTFAVTGSTVMETQFQVPGATTPAFVRGFGVVFVDVDRQGSATLEFFGLSGRLGRFDAPVQSAGSPLSFLGVVFQDTVVTRVLIVSGHAPLGAGVKDLSDGGRDDLVVMDDFLYSEPQAR
jgi:hypothetical protein